MSSYSAPAGIDDFAAGADPAMLASGWHDTVRGWIQERAKPDAAFFDALDSQGQVVPIAWDAFPLALRAWFAADADPDRARLRAADTLAPYLPGGRALRAVNNGQLGEPLELFHRQQDEYCEWFTHRDASGTITRIDFTCEGPEYWTHLATNDPDLCLELYRRHADPAVTMSDLFWQHDVAAFRSGQWRWWARAGDYNILNKWTTTHGAMHLTHPANTLGAEINLAADATTLRGANGTVLDDPAKLICCAGYGSAGRSSDPLIGHAVHRAVAGGKRVGLANPVGLYIADLTEGAFTDSNGDPVQAWQVTRGNAAARQILRATFTPPEDTPVLVGGIGLGYAGQVADHIQMVLYGVVEPNPSPAADPIGCDTKCCTHPDRPGIRIVVEPATDCAGIEWDSAAPRDPDSPAPQFTDAAWSAAETAATLVTEAAPATRSTRLAG